MRLTISGSASELTRFIQLAETAGCKIESTATSVEDHNNSGVHQNRPIKKKKVDYLSAQWHIWHRIERYPYGAQCLVRKLGCEYRWNTLGKLLDFHNPNPEITQWQINVLAEELGIDPDVVLAAFDCPKYE
jgi:hypothetical protein